jgi:hypothetical protein
VCSPLCNTAERSFCRADIAVAIKWMKFMLEIPVDSLRIKELSRLVRSRAWLIRQNQPLTWEMHQSRSLSEVAAGRRVYEHLLHNARLCFAGHAPGCHNRSLLCTTFLYATCIRRCYVTNRVTRNTARRPERGGGKGRFACSKEGSIAKMHT